MTKKLSNGFTAADELARAMHANLNPSINVEHESALAFQALETAAELFETEGMIQASAYITHVLSRFGSRE